MCYNLCSCQEQEQSPAKIQQRNMKNFTESNARCVCARKRKEHDEEDSFDHCCKATKSSTTAVSTHKDTITKVWTLPCQEGEKDMVAWSSGEKWNSMQGHEKIFMDEMPSKKNQSSKTSKILKKSSDLQQKIAEVERKLEERAGHPLSRADKLKDEELSKLMRKQMKLKRKQKEYKEKERKETPRSFENLRDRVETNMGKFREMAGRPCRLEEMTLAEKEAEKKDLLEQLEMVEEELGCLATKENRQAFGDLYMRLRQLKRSTRKPFYNGAALIEIPENESIQVTSTPSRRSSVDSIGEEDEEEEEEIEEDEKDEKEREEEWHTMTEIELQSTLKEMRQRKKVLGRLIQEFQQKFLVKTGKKVTEEDKEPIKIVYRMYKKTKHRIRLLDALLFKFKAGNFNGQ